MPRSLDSLQPTEFESLTYDLLQSAGLRNLVWRTPGADGGRDIEGEIDIVDFSGFRTKQSWYVECKRYSSTLDWPTVWNKIAYADNHGADYLLIVTNSSPSPACETQISIWNAARHKTRVRVWRGYELQQILLAYPAVAVKYGVRDGIPQGDAQFLPLLAEIMKISQAGYATLEFGGNAEPSLETAAAIAELVSLRMDQLNRLGRAVAEPLVALGEPYPWVDLHGVLSRWPEIGLRAVLTFYRNALKARGVVITVTGTTAQLDPRELRIPFSETTISSLRTIALWSDLEIGELDPASGRLTVNARE